MRALVATNLPVSVITIEELPHVGRTKPHLAQRITDKRLLEVMDFLRLGATPRDAPDTPIERFTRNPKDNSLIGHASADLVALPSNDRGSE